MFWAVLPASVTAQQVGNCSASLSPIRMADCAFAELQRADEQMKQVLVRYRPRLSLDKQQLLDLSQNHWQDYMVRACEFEASGVAGGSAYPTVIALCRSRLTHQRRIDLIKLYRCKEGDLNCPAPNPSADSDDDDD